MPRVWSLPVLALLTGAVGSAWGQGIYTCVDAQGRRLTSDRPIAACLDREQKEMNPSGTVRRTVPPSMTAVERAAQEEKDRKVAEDRQRAAEEKRMTRALLTRYPRQSVHDMERGKALQAIDDSIHSAQRRIQALQEERRKLVAESEWYKAPELWPAKLKRQFEESYAQEGAQQRFIANQQEEKKRINTRFDDELARLKGLWAQASPAAAMPAVR
ncbi:MAG TPA: DUF4124 domain-containing protein [Ramlibacter sp.]|uniref:DUF4124 domain-containing protein n=1 Tax=Ramlibacter sp. TaxID=1917967 RepID=UPI002ED3E936